jgi:hypothetical protein
VDRNTAIIAMTAIFMGGLIVTTLIITIGQLVSRRKRALPVDDSALVRIEDRLSRMEGAIDAMSIEMERISEGQRFTTKLLSDRTEQPVR